MSSIDSRADFEALLDELQIPEAVQSWLKDEGFQTISDLTFAFIQSADGEALLSKIPAAVWTSLKVVPAEATTSVAAGRIRRLLFQGRVMVTQAQSATTGPASTSVVSSMAPPSWQERAPPRLTPEAVAAMTETFTKNFPGELLTPDSTPSIRLLSIIHHQLRPGQSLRYVPWQLRLSQKQYQDMMEAKTHKAVRSEAQLLGAIWDDTPELSLDQVRLSSEWLLKVQQVFRNAFVLCGAAHLHTFKKFDQKVFDLTMKKFSPESNLRSVTLAELLEADKCIWAEIISLVSQQWSLDDALHELSSARADLYGLLQPRPRAPTSTSSTKGAGKNTVKPGVKKTTEKKFADSSANKSLCTFIIQNGERRTLCQRFQSGRSSKPSVNGDSPEEVAPLKVQRTEPVPHPSDFPPGIFSTPGNGKFFLNLFGQRSSPLLRAASLLHVDAIFPPEADFGLNILDDSVYEQVLRLVWGRWIGALWSSPPTVQESHSSADFQQQQFVELHSRSSNLLAAAHSQGAVVGVEAPFSAENFAALNYSDLLRSWNATCCRVAACSWGLGCPQTWVLCSNAPELQQLASCCACENADPSRVGHHVAENFPSNLAVALLQVLAKKCTFFGQSVEFQMLPLSRAGDPLAPLQVCDGAGLASTADWSSSRKPDVFLPLRESLWQMAQEHSVDKTILHHIAHQHDFPPLSSQQLAPFVQLTDRWLRQQGVVPSWHIDHGQSFRLGILQCLALITEDPDLAVLHALQHGVPTGVLHPLQPSGLWPRKASIPTEDQPLTVHETNWQAAEENPDLTQSLIDAEIAQGWVCELAGGLAEARARWAHIAVGKLNVIQVPGKAPRLVLDSSSCAVNSHCHLPESMLLPSVDDIRRALASSQDIGEFSGLALDIHAAHKQVRLHPEECGLVLFQFKQRTYYYTVAHFGARFSAWWWQRLAGLLLRLLHQFLHAPHRGWVYVDDILLLLRRACFPKQVTLAVLFLLLLNTPISWKKAQMGDRLSWIGWDLDLALDTVQLTMPKVEKLRELLLELLRHKQTKVKTLETALGMLIWFSSVARYLRPHLAELYRCLHSPPASLYSVPATFWAEFRSVLDDEARVVRSSPSLCLPIGGRVVEYSHHPISCKADLPSVPYKSNLQWVRVQDLQSSTLTLTKDATSQFRWFLALLSESRHTFSLHLPTPVVIKAAADAFAHGDSFGIGGWIITPTEIVWFSEQYSLSELKVYVPKLTKDAQKYICAFEILAQLALVLAASRQLHLRNMSIILPSASDNTAAEAGANKMLSTRWPASIFLQILGDLAFQHQIHLAVSHTPGHRNTWADELSRDSMARWLGYPRFRLSLQNVFDIGRFVHLHPQQDWPPHWQNMQKDVCELLLRLSLPALMLRFSIFSFMCFFLVITIFFGIAGLDRSGIDVYNPGAYIGKPIFDNGFDLTTSEAQAGLLSICSKVKDIKCEMEGCDNEGYDSGPLPVGSNFTTQLEEFRRTANKGDYYGDVIGNAVNYQKDIGFVGGELKYVAIHFRSVMKKRLPFSIGTAIRDHIRKWIDSERGHCGSCIPHNGNITSEHAKDGNRMTGALSGSLQSMKFHGNGEFQRYDMGEELINGLFSGIAIAMPISFVVLLCSTQNIVVAIYAVLSVGAIVLCVLGFCKSAMDWDLGVGEAIAGVIVIGYSVDYVVHLAHMYCEGKHFGHNTRCSIAGDERATFAIRNMGSTIFAGAITTVLAGATMFICWFYFFIKMALLICVTIMYSFLFSLVFFMSVLWLAGQPLQTRKRFRPHSNGSLVHRDRQMEIRRDQLDQLEDG
eukprot:s3697_g2.t1